MKRGDIFWVELSPRSGSEQQGRRPAIVLTHDALNSIKTWRSIVVVPLSTSAKQAQRGPTAVPIPSGTCGLERDGVALCHQITTLDRAKFLKKIGGLSEEALHQIEQGIKAALDMS